MEMTSVQEDTATIPNSMEDTEQPELETQCPPAAGEDNEERETEGEGEDKKEKEGEGTPEEEEGKEEEMTDEEAEVMRADLLAKARAVQVLIRTLQDNEAQLRDVVQDFVLREYAEQQVGSTLANRVELQQVVHLQNPKYLRWAVEHKKGEYNADRGMVTEDAFIKAELDREHDTPVEWFTCLMPENRPLNAKHLVESTVPMLCQWREPTDYHKVLTEGFCLRWERELLDQGTLQEEMVYFANGSPLLDTTGVRMSMGLTTSSKDGSAPLSLAQTPSLAEKENFQPQQHDIGEDGEIGAIAKVAEPMLLPEDPVLLKAAAQLFRTQWASAQGVNAQYFTYTNFLSLLAIQKDLYSTLACSCHLDSVLDPENNIITAARVKDVARSAVVRAFIFGGTLRAVEGIEHNVDVFSALGLTDKSVVARVEDFVTVNAGLFRSRRAAVVTLLVPTAITTEDGTAPLISVHTATTLAPPPPPLIVICLKDFTPELPFKWRFDFTDMCGIGRSGLDGSPMKVVVRRTNYEAARLTPFDVLSTLVLEWVCNPQEEEEASTAVSSQTAANTDDRIGTDQKTAAVTSTRQFMQAAIVVGAVLAGSVVASKILLKNR